MKTAVVVLYYNDNQLLVESILVFLNLVFQCVYGLVGGLFKRFALLAGVQIVTS